MVMEENSQSCNLSCMYTNICNVATQQRLYLFLSDDLCTRVEYLGRLNALADSQLWRYQWWGRHITWGSWLHITFKSWFAVKIEMDQAINILLKSWLRVKMRQKSMTLKRHIYHFVLWTTVNQLIKGFRRGQSNDQVQMLLIKYLDSSHKRSRRQQTTDYSLVNTCTHRSRGTATMMATSSSSSSSSLLNPSSSPTMCSLAENRQRRKNAGSRHFTDSQSRARPQCHQGRAWRSSWRSSSCNYRLQQELLHWRARQRPCRRPCRRHSGGRRRRR